jgi:hypothetical protein
VCDDAAAEIDDRIHPEIDARAPRSASDHPMQLVGGPMEARRGDVERIEGYGALFPSLGAWEKRGERRLQRGAGGQIVAWLCVDHPLRWRVVIDVRVDIDCREAGRRDGFVVLET